MERRARSTVNRVLGTGKRPRRGRAEPKPRPPAASPGPAIVASGWADDLKGARRFEVLGQRDDPRLAAIEAAIDFAGLIGIARIEERIRQLAASAQRQLREIPGVQLKTSAEPRLSGGVIRFRLPRMPAQRAYDALWERHRLAIALPTSGDAEGLRFSPHVY